MITVNEIAKLLKADVTGDGDTPISGMSSPAYAKEGDITFAMDEGSFAAAGKSSAACILTTKGAPELPKTSVRVEDMKTAVTLLYNIMEEIRQPAEGTIHPSAVIPESAKLGKNVAVGANAAIGENASIGDNTAIGACSVVGDDVTIGSYCRIYPNVTLYDHTTIGNKVGIHSGSVIGSDGFGYVNQDGKIYKVPQLGTVIIEDGVEIGSNTSVDRGTFSDTVIGKNSKLDNLVQVAHNVKLGQNVLLAAQVGIAGSSTIGDNTMLGGKSGVSDHCDVGKNVKIAAKAGVISHVRDNMELFGYPSRDAKAAINQMAFLSWMTKRQKKVRALLKNVPEKPKK